MFPAMKLTGLASLLLLAAACTKGDSKLDTSTGGVPKEGKEAKGAIGGAAVTGGAVDTKAVDDLKMKVANLENQLQKRLGDLETDLKGYDKFRTPLEIVASKVAADKGQFTVPSEIVIDARLKALERYGETLEWIAEIHEQQKKQQEAKEAQELDPSGTYAVDVEPAVRAGQVEGPVQGALVTIVEAWDYA
jgi:hypothetical protein